MTRDSRLLVDKLLFETAPVDLQGMADGMTPEQCDETRKSLEGVAEKAASFSAYFNEHSLDNGHKKAVKAFNSVLRKVRHALGYCRTDDIHF